MCIEMRNSEYCPTLFVSSKINATFWNEVGSVTAGRKTSPDSPIAKPNSSVVIAEKPVFMLGFTGFLKFRM